MNLMNRIILLSLVMVTLLLSQCNNAGRKTTAGNAASDTGVAKIVFREYEHDFGKVAEGEKVGYDFKFENQGSASLVIVSATASCGCTVPRYDARPISAGSNGSLEVIFDTAGRSGRQTKTVTVKSNAEPPVVLLKITAEVIEGDQ